MSYSVVFYADPDNRRSRTAIELAPDELDVGVLDPGLPWEEQLAQLQDTEVLILGGPAPSTEQLAQLPRLRLLQLMSAGYDQVDVPAVKENGVFVSNNSPQIAASVSQLTIGLMIMVMNRLLAGVEGVRDGSWAEKARARPIHELMGKTVGIVGLGNIGKDVARRLAGFDCKLVYYDAFDVPAEVEAELNVCRVEVDELLRISDVVTVHVPLYSGSRGMFNAQTFALMKESAIFINACRGPVHDEADLIEALRSGEIAGAGLDVLEQEPASLDNPLLHMDNVVVTPHLGGSSEERVERALVFSYENARRVFAGDEPLGQITPLV